jgi:hypothetical protein
MNLIGIGNVARNIDALERPEPQVVIPGQVLDLRSGASPGNQEDLMALSDGIFDKRVPAPRSSK